LQGMSDGSKVWWWPALLPGTRAVCDEAGGQGHRSRAGLCLAGAEQFASLNGLLEASARNSCVWFPQNMVAWGICPLQCPWSQCPILLGGPSALLESAKVWVGAGYHLPARDADPINFSGRKSASGSLAHLQITRSK